MNNFRDQLGRHIDIISPPRRVISLVPSQTELLHDLGLDEEVVGITKFCVHPAAWFRTKTRVGGTKKLHTDVIRGLQPDLILANKEENEKTQLETLMHEFPVWVSDIHTLADALDMIRSVGAITGKKEKAAEMAGQIRRAFSTLHADEVKADKHHRTKAAYFIWRDPWMVAGKNTFIDDMMHYCGLENCFADVARYPEISLSQLHDAGCRLVILSSEPYPFKEKHAAEIRRVLPEVRILFADGEMFSWYGSRLLKAPAYFSGLPLNG